MNTNSLKTIYPTFEAMTISLCRQKNVPMSKVPIIIQNTLAKIELKTLNNTEKQDLITDFKRLVREEIKQMQTQN